MAGIHWADAAFVVVYVGIIAADLLIAAIKMI